MFYILNEKIDENNIIPILYNTANLGLKDLESKMLEILQKKSILIKMINNPLLLKLPYKWFSEMFTKNNTSCRIDEAAIFDICVKYCKNEKQSHLFLQLRVYCFDLFLIYLL